MLRTLRRLTLAAALAAALAPGAEAQELNCRISVNFSALPGNEFDFLRDLQRGVEEYLNDRSWTEDRFEPYERIDCTVSITFTSAQGLDRFNAQIAVGASRPIYGVLQRTTTFQVLDGEWEFQYNRGQPLLYDPNRFNELTSLLDFYAYLILGYDYDTFSELGGTPFFQRARQIAELGQAQGVRGWVAIGDDNTRTSLVRQLLDARYEPLRRAYFRYHLGGLDRFSRQPERGWQAAFEAIEAVHELFQETSRKYALDVFFSTKSAEIAQFFQEAADLRNPLYALLVEMDPARSSDYDRLVQR